MTLLGVLLGLSALVLAWILIVNRKLSARTMHEEGFRATRLRLYLALAGVAWMLSVPGGVGLYVMLEMTPRLRASAELPLWMTLLVVGIVVPWLIVRSANLARTYRK